MVPSVPGPSVLQASEEGVRFAALMGKVLDLVFAQLWLASTPAATAALT
jgi:hypothetical protein